MPKHLIIDGYNVLGALGLPPSQVVGSGEAHREQFIARLSLYAQTIHCRMTVVFDAWRQAGGDATHQSSRRDHGHVFGTGGTSRSDHSATYSVPWKGGGSGVFGS